MNKNSFGRAQLKLAQRTAKKIIHSTLLLAGVVLMLNMGAAGKTVDQTPSSNRVIKSSFYQNGMWSIDSLYEPLVWSGIAGSQEENLENEQIKTILGEAKDKDDFYKRLEAYVKEKTESGYAMVIELNLGRWNYDAGRFSSAIEAYERAWGIGEKLTEGKKVSYEVNYEEGKDVVRPEVKALADRSLGELMAMHSRLGHDIELNKLLEKNKNRVMVGTANNLKEWGEYAKYMFEKEPGVSYLCGPMAVKSILENRLEKEKQANMSEVNQTKIKKQLKQIEAYQSPKDGVSLKELMALLKETGLDWQAVKYEGISNSSAAAGIPQTPVQPKFPVPSVVHWRVNHYAAIVDYRDGKYEVKDPTFGIQSIWMTEADIEKETSGYFVIAKGEAKEKTKEMKLARVVNEEEQNRLGKSVYGRGATDTVPDVPPPPDTDDDNNNDDDDKNKDDKDKKPCRDKGMPVCGASNFNAEITIYDTPLVYRPPVGPIVRFQLLYNAGGKALPAVMNFGNVGPKWTYAWQGYYQGGSPGGIVMRGSLVQYRWNAGAFNVNDWRNERLYKTSAGYELREIDGGKWVYEHGSCSNPTDANAKCFLTARVDEQGNKITFQYDTQNRITTVTDALGKKTTLGYENTANTYLITKVTDPIGRTAKLEYDNQGNLSTVTDMIGLKSGFSYGDNGLVSVMGTPYGNWTYESGGVSSFNERTTTITDPLGNKEGWRRMGACDNYWFVEEIPDGFRQYQSNPAEKFLRCRNVGYYHKNGGVTYYHWLHAKAVTNMLAPVLESVKVGYGEQGSNREWYVYPGQEEQGNTMYEGTSPYPIKKIQVMPDGSTRVTEYAHNELGNLTYTKYPMEMK